jgi:hypothetical protein
MAVPHRKVGGQLMIAASLSTGFLLSSFLGVPVPQLLAQAIEYSDGVVGFSYPLRLTDSRTTRSDAGASSVTYYLRFNFPNAAEEPLDRVVITLDEGRRDPVFGYRLEATRAVATTEAGEFAVPLGEITQDEQTKALTIHFDPPVEPGQEITLALKPYRNPRFEGVYLFGATAYPVGTEVEPTFMGYARFNFYSPDGYRWH